MKLVIIRHPETNKAAGLPGEQEAPSPEGKVQLSRVAEACVEGVQAVVYSTQPRATIAGEALAEKLGVPHIAQEGLAERNFGDRDEWEWSRIAAELNKMTTEDRYTFVPPNGESWQQVEHRLQVVLTHVATLGYDSVALMTHWGAIRALLPVLRGEPKESTLKLEVINGQVFVEEYTLDR